MSKKCGEKPKKDKEFECSKCGAQSNKKEKLCKPKKTDK
jgi:uncharacterized membrane protein YvbJ